MSVISPSESACCLPGDTCCTSSHLSLIDYLERGLRRRREPAYSVVGEVRRDHEGRTAQFSVQLNDTVIQSVSFKTSSCATLIAYCEVLAQWATGLTLQAAVRVRPPQLLAALPSVPAYKRYCAILATAAFLSVVQTAVQGLPL